MGEAWERVKHGDVASGEALAIYETDGVRVAPQLLIFTPIATPPHATPPLTPPQPRSPRPGAAAVRDHRHAVQH